MTAQYLEKVNCRVIDCNTKILQICIFYCGLIQKARQRECEHFSWPNLGRLGMSTKEVV